MKRLLLVSLTCWIIPSISGQAKIDYFKDNTVRLNSVVVGSLQEGNSVYFWGGGTGYNPNMPILYKIDGQGPVKWHTANDTLLGLPGYFLSAFSDASYLYMIGYNVTDRNSRYFLAKVDKEQGRIVYIRDSIPLHVTGIMHWKDLGSEIRIISSTYDYQYYPNNKLPIVSTLLNKDNGVFSAPVDYGLPGLYPQFFDDADNVYYLSSQDSVMKYHVPSASIKWKSKIFTPDVLPSKFPSVTVKKENNLLFIMGNRYVWAFNDSVGNRLWDIKVPTYSNMDFYPYHVHFVKDSLYTSWSHPYSGSVTQFGLFAKINKNSGQIYYNGTVTDTGGIRHESEGYMTNPEFSVDDKGDIYMVSENTYSGDRKYKKLAGTTGRMIYQLPLVADQVITNNYNVISGIKNSRYSKTYFFDNSPYFLFHNNVLGDKGKSTTHINYYKFNPSIPVILEKNNFDNNYLQYPSSIIDIERYGEFTLVLKRQGQIAFVEKYTSEMNLEWQREITEGCPSRPEMLAVDSAGMICVLSYGGCGEMMALKGYQSTDYVNRVTILDQMGNIFSNTFPMVIAHDERLELIGIEAGFFAFGRDIRYAIGYDNTLRQAITPTNFITAGSHTGFRTLSHLVNGKDSVYVFSSGDNGTNQAYYISMNKYDLRTRYVPLTEILASGFILHAKKSATNPNHIYLAGFNGNEHKAAVVRLDMTTRKIVWHYLGSKVGSEAVKIAEDNKGYIYVFLKSDSIAILKFRAADGKLIWMYRQAEDSYARCIDIAVNPLTGTLIAAISKINPLNLSTYAAQLLEINMETGKLNNQQMLQSNSGSVFINKVESNGGPAILFGGNTTDKTLGGQLGFFGINTTKDSSVTKPCALSADFTFTVDKVNLTVYQFINSTISDSTTKFKWYFGNGDSSLAKNPAYRFPLTGKYVVTLIADNSAGCNNTITKIIEVEQPRLCNILPGFSFSIDSMFKTKTYFTNTTDSVAISYSWDFGDGYTDSSKNPVHQYIAPGSYRVCLQVLQTPGCVKNFCQTVQMFRSEEKTEIIPNPVGTSARLFLDAAIPGIFTVRLLDSRGHIIDQFSYAAIQGPNYIVLNVGGLLPGIYFVTVGNGNQQERTRFIKL